MDVFAGVGRGGDVGAADVEVAAVVGGAILGPRGGGEEKEREEEVHRGDVGEFFFSSTPGFCILYITAHIEYFTGRIRSVPPRLRFTEPRGSLKRPNMHGLHGWTNPRSEG